MDMISKFSEKYNLLKLGFVVLGIVVSILGRLIADAEYIPWISHVLTPKYHIMSDTLEMQNQDGCVINRKDAGFDGILHIILSDQKITNEDTGEIAKGWDLYYFKKNITEIKTISSGLKPILKGKNVVENLKYGIEFELTVVNNPPQSSFRCVCFDLNDKLKNEYCSKPLYKAGNWVFYFGILITLFAAINSEKYHVVKC